MPIPGSCSAVNIAAERLAGAFCEFCGELDDRTSGAADYTRRIGEVLGDVDQRSRLSAEFTTRTPTSRTAIPTPGTAGPVMLSGRHALDDFVTR